MTDAQRAEIVRLSLDARRRFRAINRLHRTWIEEGLAPEEARARWQPLVDAYLPVREALNALLDEVLEDAAP
jgi:hypothetical protein